MHIITISREFGSGGRELGKRLADALGFDYYDREIITAIAAAKGLDERYVSHTLEHHGWQNIPLNFRSSFTGFPPPSSIQTDLLLAQKQVIEEIAKAGKDCVIVGRNADVLLKDYNPFNLFVCAQMETRVRRCMERASESEDLSQKELEKRIRRMDKIRAQTRQLLTASPWGQAHTYDLVINTTTWDIKTLTPAVAQFAQLWFRRNQL